MERVVIIFDGIFSMRGNETIRFQINVAYTKADVDYATEALTDFKN